LGYINGPTGGSTSAPTTVSPPVSKDSDHIETLDGHREYLDPPSP
jgi:hypothetical protein